LERIGDYAKGIGRINLMIAEGPHVKPLIDIPAMAALASGMLMDAVQAFADRDARRARTIPARDEEMDALYNQVYRELMTYIIADPRNIEPANRLLWAAHNLERTGDRVTNICERVVFAVTGEMSEMDSEDEGLESLT
jgi:phosphate transport system protein